jgi:hypothetical protein
MVHRIAGRSIRKAGRQEGRKTGRQEVEGGGVIQPPHKPYHADMTFPRTKHIKVLSIKDIHSVLSKYSIILSPSLLCNIQLHGYSIKDDYQPHMRLRS